MPDDVVTVRLSHQNAVFLKANLAVLATATRQAMSRPGIEAERRAALGNRATLLERIEDAVHGAILEPGATRKGPVRMASRQSNQASDRQAAA
jgi:hypothetical protein